MRLNPKKQPSNSQSPRAHSVVKFVQRILDSYGPQFEARNISVETDLDPIETVFDLPTVRSATTSLLDNAIESMPDGGELAVTLIDGIHQWELEIADTPQSALCKFEQNPKRERGELPVIVPFPETEPLRDAHRAATEQGGQVQTWNCPLGGVAHVLVIPKQPFAWKKSPSADAETA